jgi:hypothetical protein
MLNVINSNLLKNNDDFVKDLKPLLELLIIKNYCYIDYFKLFETHISTIHKNCIFNFYKMILIEKYS